MNNNDQELLKMSWPEIQKNNLKTVLFSHIGIKDKMLDDLLYKKDFVMESGYIDFYTMCNKYCNVKSDEELMELLFDLVQGFCTKKVSIENIIKYIKANLLVTRLVSKAIEKIFKDLQFYSTPNNVFYYYNNALTSLHGSILKQSQGTELQEIVKYEFNIDISKKDSLSGKIIKNRIIMIEMNNSGLPFDESEDILSLSGNTLINRAEIFVRMETNENAYHGIDRRITPHIKNLAEQVKDAIINLINLVK